MTFHPGIHHPHIAHHFPLPWPLVDKLIAGVALATAWAARRDDLSPLVGERAWTNNDDGTNCGPHCQF